MGGPYCSPKGSGVHDWGFDPGILWVYMFPRTFSFIPSLLVLVIPWHSPSCLQLTHVSSCALFSPSHAIGPYNFVQSYARNTGRKCGPCPTALPKQVEGWSAHGCPRLCDSNRSTPTLGGAKIFRPDQYFQKKMVWEDQNVL